MKRNVRTSWIALFIMAGSIALLALPLVLSLRGQALVGSRQPVSTSAGGLDFVAEELGPMPDASRLALTVVSVDCRNAVMILADRVAHSRLFLNGACVQSSDDIPLAAIRYDGNSLAYLSRFDVRRMLVIEGNALPSLATPHDLPESLTPDVLTFSPDGAHFAYVARDGGKEFVVMDGTAGVPCDRIVEGIGDGDVGYVLFSPDGHRFAYIAQVGDLQDLVIDGKKVADGLRISDVSFSHDSQHVAFKVRLFEKNEVHFHVDDKDIGHSDAGTGPVFSDDGKHVAYAAETKDPLDVSAGTTSIVLDGRTGPPIVENDGAAQRTGARPVVSHITFSPDGKHLAFDQQRVQGANRGVVYHYHHVNLDGLEGKEYARIYGITFSPDGRALAYSAYDIMGGVDSTPRGWLTVLGNKEGPVYESVLAPVFSPDSQHYAYAARKDGHWLMVLDGHEIGQYVPIVSEAFGRSNVIDDHFPSPYRFDSDDKLVFLGLSDGRILRVICKPNANSALRQ